MSSLEISFLTKREVIKGKSAFSVALIWILAEWVRMSGMGVGVTDAGLWTLASAAIAPLCLPGF